MRDRAATRGARYLLLVAAVVVAALAGYVGYLLYPRFDLPSVAGAGLLALAAAAGFAAFFSPCSFPLLATLLARQTGAGQPPRMRLRRALLFAASLSVGAVTFVLLLGVLLAGAGRGLASGITFTSTPGRILRVAVGLGLIVLGLVQTERLRVNLRVAESAIHGLLSRPARLLHHHPVAWFALFGFGYLAAGFGWTGPIMAGLAIQALTVGGFAAALAAFVVTAAVLVGLLFAAALLVATAQQQTVERLRAGTPTVKRWGGWVLIAVGGWFVILGVWAGQFARLFPV